jgi:hypothetical protein
MKLTRRDFLKYSGTTIGAAAIGGTVACAKHSPDWKPISYPRIALYNGNVFNGIDKQLIKDQIVLIDGGSIQSIEPRGDLSGFKNYKLIDIEGRTQLPGLIDNHVHITVPFVSGLELGVDLGFDTMEHMLHDKLIPKGLINRFNKKGMVMLPTILVYHDNVIEKHLFNMVQAKGKNFLTPEAVKQVTSRMQKSLELHELNLSKQERKHLKFDPWYIKDKVQNMFANLK